MPKNKPFRFKPLRRIFFISRLATAGLFHICATPGA
nr:MAG TPA_asm: hypothetical protein [Caudoviricetes sp.]